MEIFIFKTNKYILKELRKYLKQLFSDGKPITLPVQTKNKHFLRTANTDTLHIWNEWLILPLRYCDLPRNVLAVITVWKCHGPCTAKPVGGTTVPLFGKYSTFKQVSYIKC